MKPFKVIFIADRYQPPAMTGLEFETREAAEEAIMLFLENPYFNGFGSERPEIIRLYK